MWEDSGAELSPDFAPVLMPYLGHQHEDVRSAAADALAAAVEVRKGGIAAECKRCMVDEQEPRTVSCVSVVSDATCTPDKVCWAASFQDR